MKTKTFLSALLLLLLISCQKEEFQFQDEEVDGPQVSLDVGQVHSSILKSDWWKSQPQFAKDVLGVELASTDNPITYSQLEEKFNKARRAALKNSFRATVCPGFPSNDPVINPYGHVDLCTQAEVDAFGALNCKEITGRLRIFDTLGVDPICDLSPLRKIKHIGSALNISGGDCLTSLDGLEKLKTVGDLGPFGFVAVRGPVLSDIEALSNLRSVTGSINVLNSPNLVSVTSAFERITSIDSSFIPIDTFVSQYVLNIDNNASLVDISGFRNLVNIDRGLYIRNNASLQHIDDLSALSGNLHFLFVNNNAVLDNIDGLSGITSFSNGIFIYENASLQNIDGLSAVTSVALNVFLLDNPSLSDCCGLYNLVCSDPPFCSISGIGGSFVSDGCQEVDIIAGGPCL